MRRKPEKLIEFLNANAFYVALVLYFFSQITFGQEVVWQKTELYSNWTTGNSIKQTSDGNYVIAGRRGGSGYLGFVAKLNNLGDTLWVRYLPATIGMTSVIETSSGDFVAVGDNRLVVKLSPLGSIIWMKNIPETGYSLYFYHLIETVDMKIVAVGKCETGSPTIRSGYMVKIDTNGNKLWSKIIRPGNTQSTLQNVKQLHDGGYILSGGITIINNVQQLLIRTNINGDTLWTKNYGSSFNESGNIVFQTSNYDYLIIGTIWYNNQHIKLYYTKTDSSGTLEWSRIYGDTNTYFNLRSSDCAVKVDYNNTYVITGVKSTEAFLLAIDPYGNKIWEKTYPMDTLEISGSSVDLCNDSSYVVCGDAFNFPPLDLDAQFLYVLKTTKADPIGIYYNEIETPVKYRLHQNFPNPFNPKTIIKYEVPKSTYITIKIFDSLGKEVGILVDRQHQAGIYSVLLNASNYASGIYFVQFTDNKTFSKSNKIVLIK
ncbi:MAG: T9SS type A sorting domain-containing protein [Ignavibacteria bacterium]|nr:T9SS type A sorting domain-containing protein [Ignavibacteria bacterium]